eukprot:GGOE01036165.1.p1 GENE.GGOE01036165.1~~GGOE01036165.1.p1  ORF type:complete len:208 (-),score=45.92 GGOE01036165.1:296-919(-)
MDSIPSFTMKLIMKELSQLHQEKMDGINVLPNDDEVSCITAEIAGPENTAFEGGIFVVRLVLDADYPNSPPKGYFMTKVFHPNISNKGEICVNTLKKDWQRDCGLKHVLMVIRCLLIEPNPESALNMEAGHLLLENFDEFYQRAKLFTQLYAVKDSAKENLVADLELRKASSPTSAKSTSSILSHRSENTSVPTDKKVEKKKSLKRL